MDWVHINYFEYNKKVIVDSYGKWLDFEIVSHCDTKNTTLCLNGFLNMVFQYNWSQIMEYSSHHKNSKTLLKR